MACHATNTTWPDIYSLKAIMTIMSLVNARPSRMNDTINILHAIQFSTFK